MRFTLFAEGFTEKKALPAFLKRCLDPQLARPVKINVVRFDGWGDYERHIAKRVNLHLTTFAGEIIAAIGLIDLYGPTFYPKSCMSVAQRVSWTRTYFVNVVSDPGFRQHFAVHETEAWLLSDPRILPVNLPGGCNDPESVNVNQPPAKLLDNLYKAQLGRPYRKVVDGYNLFSKLSPEIARTKCTYLDQMLREMLHLARSTGL